MKNGTRPTSAGRRQGVFSLAEECFQCGSQREAAFPETGKCYKQHGNTSALLELLPGENQPLLRLDCADVACASFLSFLFDYIFTDVFIALPSLSSCAAIFLIRATVGSGSID